MAAPPNLSTFNSKVFNDLIFNDPLTEPSAVPTPSGISATGIRLTRAELDPILALKPGGATIRQLRLAGRRARQRLRGG